MSRGHKATGQGLGLTAALPKEGLVILTSTRSPGCRVCSLRWIPRMGLGLLGLLLWTGSLQAGVLDVSWNAPTTNADGTALTDLMTYHLYVGTSASCRGASSLVVPSPKSAPAPGDVVSVHLTGLVTGAQYVVQVTAVDAGGAESNCSLPATGVAKPDADTTPPSGTVTINGGSATLTVTYTPAGATAASLNVRSLAGTQIYLGGNSAYLGSLQGSVPATGELSLQGLTPKTYLIRATLPGFSDAYRQVPLAPGANVLSLEMTPYDLADALSSNLSALANADGAAIKGGGHYSAPFVVDWNNDGKKDLLIAGGDGAILLYLNGGSDAAPQFGTSQALEADGTPTSVLGPACVFVVDWDNDGNKDLLVGDGQDSVRWYRNIGTDDAPILTAMGPLQAGRMNIQVAGPASPVVVDWNDDGKKDLLVGGGDGSVRVFLNVGTDAAPVLAAGLTITLPDVGVVRSNARPFVVDWNEDGRKDLLVGDKNGQIYLFLNTGTDAAPAFASGAPLSSQAGAIVVSSNATPFVVDWNNRALRDLVIGTNDGEVFLSQGTTPLASTGTSSSSAGGSNGGGCFIATAAYGTPLAPQVQVLREFRDRYLLTNPIGRAFVALYYRVSPPLANVIAGSEALRAIVRVGLYPILWLATLILRSPGMGLGVLLATFFIAAGIAFYLARRSRRTHAWGPASRNPWAIRQTQIGAEAGRRPS